MVENRCEFVMDALGGLMIPGLGQLMRGRLLDGLFFMLAALAGYLLFFPFGVFFHIWSFIAVLFPNRISGIIRYK